VTDDFEISIFANGDVIIDGDIAAASHWADMMRASLEEPDNVVPIGIAPRQRHV
jgi:hypothetical protein